MAREHLTGVHARDLEHDLVDQPEALTGGDQEAALRGVVEPPTHRGCRVADPPIEGVQHEQGRPEGLQACRQVVPASDEMWTNP